MEKNFWAETFVLASLRCIPASAFVVLDLKGINLCRAAEMALAVATEGRASIVTVVATAEMTTSGVATVVNAFFYALLRACSKALCNRWRWLVACW